MTHEEYKIQRQRLLLKFSQLGVTGVSKAFRLLKETGDPIVDAVRYTEQLEDMSNNLHNYRAARRNR